MELLDAVRAMEDGFSGRIEYDTPLSRVTYYRIGGPARVLVEPRTFEDLERVHQVIRRTKAPFFVFGWGSNLLFGDEEYPGIMIRMKHLGTGVEEIRPGVLRVGASLGANTLLKVAAERGYGGLARFTGIPGSIGGMIAMNAGTHLGEMSEVLIRTEWVNLLEDSDTLTVHSRVHEAGDFSYRSNHFLRKGDLILSAEIRHVADAPEKVKAEIDSLYQRRKNTQPVEYPSCGSVFMNPRESGMSAWEVVERLGFRGRRIGGAQVSEKHPNFIVNLGGATAADVRALIAQIQQAALKELGIVLEPEVKILP
jgi:UDP-N-acetylmuramate dehydrogenase